MRLEFHLKKYTCLACSTTRLVPGPLGGNPRCVCGRPYSLDDKTEQGDLIDASIVQKWWNGLLYFCASCSGVNDNNSAQCKNCNAPATEGIRPDNANVSAELKALLLKMGIDLNSHDGIAREEPDVEPIYQAPVESDPPPVYKPVTTYTPHRTYSAPQPSFDFGSLQPIIAWGLGGIAVILVFVGLFMGLRWLLTPQNEVLTVTGFSGQLSSGYSYITVETGKCYEDEYDCPSSEMTPVSRETVVFQPSGSVVIATVVATEINNVDIRVTVEPGPEYKCDEADLGGVKVDAYCTPEPEYTTIQVTEIVEDSTDVRATMTPYARSELTYKKNVENLGSVTTTLPDRVPTEQLVYPNVPENATPESSLNSSTFVVYFTNGKGQQRSMSVSVYDWYTFEYGQVFENAQVDRLGIIHSLYGDE